MEAKHKSIHSHSLNTSHVGSIETKMFGERKKERRKKFFFVKNFFFLSFFCQIVKEIAAGDTES